MTEKRVRLVQSLFLLNAFAWVGLGIATLLRWGQASSPRNVIMAIMGVMMFGNAGAMLLSAWLLPKKWMPGFIFILLILAVNILLTFTDQVGFWDWLTVLIDFVLGGILLGRWRFFTGRD
jgi:hypothetical protein